VLKTFVEFKSVENVLSLNVVKFEFCHISNLHVQHKPYFSGSKQTA